MLLSKALKEGDNKIISNLTLSTCATKLFDRIKNFPEELIQEKFSFKKENIIHAYIHSSVVSPNTAFNCKHYFVFYIANHYIYSGIESDDVLCYGDSHNRSEFNETT